MSMEYSEKAGRLIDTDCEVELSDNYEDEEKEE